MKRLLVIIFLLLVPWASAAQDPLSQASAFFDDMEFQKALRVVRKVFRSARSGPSRVVAAYHLLGLCQSALGRPERAVETFRKLLALDPGFSLAPDISPKLSAPFYQAKAISRSQKPLAMSHQPPGLDSIAGAKLTLVLAANPFKLAASLRLGYHTGPASLWKTSARRIKGIGEFVFRLPQDMKGRRAEYRFELLNRHGAVLKRLPGEERTFQLEAPVVAAAPLAAQAATAGGAGGKKTPSEPPAGERYEPLTLPADDQAYEERKQAPAWYRSWWFWTVVGVVAAGGATTAAVLATSGSGTSETTVYGIRFR